LTTRMRISICARSRWMMTRNNGVCITAVRALDGGARVALSLRGGEEGEERLVLLSTRLSRLPCVGEITDEELCFYRREADVAAAIEIGMRALGLGACSRRTLLQKIRRHGIGGESAEEAVGELVRRGCLDERRAALRTAECNVRKLWGNRRILADLMNKGYEREAIEAACEWLGTQDACSRCCRLLQKRRADYPKTEEEARRLLSVLLRYGYSVGEAKMALSLLKGS